MKLPHSNATSSVTSLIDTERVAHRLGVCAETLRRWRRRGTGPEYVRLSRNVVRYEVSAVERWLHSCKEETAQARLAGAREMRPHERALTGVPRQKSSR
ncbi:helix-turn-helix transcriptional regulator [Streptomyces celluloflavus]|uniref:helix-turn-helix transcriptional regulator n=1 Tax=Streptomyces celluloflavus TaxID=58344 RepID=UPI00367C5F38